MPTEHPLVWVLAGLVLVACGACAMALAPSRSSMPYWIFAGISLGVAGSAVALFGAESAGERAAVETGLIEVLAPLTFFAPPVALAAAWVVGRAGESVGTRVGEAVAVLAIVAMGILFATASLSFWLPSRTGNSQVKTSLRYVQDTIESCLAELGPIAVKACVSRIELDEPSLGPVLHPTDPRMPRVTARALGPQSYVIVGTSELPSGKVVFRLTRTATNVVKSCIGNQRACPTGTW